MDPNVLSNGLLWTALAVFVIARQFLPRTVRPAVMIGLPVVAGCLGLRALLGAPPPTAIAVALLGLNLALGAAMGLVRGVTVRVWRDPAGTWMMQGTRLTFACWLVSIGLKVGLGVIDRAAFSPEEIALLIAVTFAAQNLVVWARVGGPLPAGVPACLR